MQLVLNLLYFSFQSRYFLSLKGVGSETSLWPGLSVCQLADWLVGFTSCSYRSTCNIAGFRIRIFFLRIRIRAKIFMRIRIRLRIRIRIRILGVSGGGGGGKGKKWFFFLVFFTFQMILNNGGLKSEQKKWNCLHCTSPTLQNNDLFIHFLTCGSGSGSETL